jgi:hypothetical protein
MVAALRVEESTSADQLTRKFDELENKLLVIVTPVMAAPPPPDPVLDTFNPQAVAEAVGEYSEISQFLSIVKFDVGAMS